MHGQLAKAQRSGDHKRKMLAAADPNPACIFGQLDKVRSSEEHKSASCMRWERGRTFCWRYNRSNPSSQNRIAFKVPKQWVDKETAEVQPGELERKHKHQRGATNGNMYGQWARTGTCVEIRPERVTERRDGSYLALRVAIHICI
eukprot:1139993-Pelagomonas_calceolata.AAC.3